MSVFSPSSARLRHRRWSSLRQEPLHVLAHLLVYLDDLLEVAVKVLNEQVAVCKALDRRHVLVQHDLVRQIPATRRERGRKGRVVSKERPFWHRFRSLGFETRGREIKEEGEGRGPRPGARRPPPSPRSPSLALFVRAQRLPSPVLRQDILHGLEGLPHLLRLYALQEVLRAQVLVQVLELQGRREGRVHVHPSRRHGARRRKKGARRLGDGRYCRFWRFLFPSGGAL